MKNPQDMDKQMETIQESMLKMHEQILTLLIVSLLSLNAHAVTPQTLMNGYLAQAKQENPKFKEFSASRGEQFYHAKRAHSSGQQMNCATCHTDNPMSVGAHAKTRKEI